MQLVFGYLVENHLPQPYEKTTPPTGDIPKPELNPMTNPVLGRHLGRWAEAYFTTPIEQREQAVIELLHQLEREEENEVPPNPSPRFEARDLPSSVKQNLSSIDELENPKDRLAALEEAIRQFDGPRIAPAQIDAERPRQRELESRSLQSPGVCPVCRHLNQLDQWYCGMCGFRLRAEDDSQTRVLAFPQSTGTESSVQTTASTGEHPSEAQPTNSFSFSMFGEPLESRESDDDFRLNRPSMWPLDTVEELPSSRVGAKVAAICVILLIAAAAFFYREQIRGFVKPWLVSQQSGQNVPASPPRSIATEPAATGAAPENTSNRPEAQSSTGVPGEHAPARANEASAAPTPEDHGSKPENAKSPVSTSSNNKVPPSAQKRPLEASPMRDAAIGPPHGSQNSGTPTESGNEELARARALLSGGSKPTDPSQASIWLWKAVGKNNGAAVILLADLYARGNGVPQSCDQARILLSAAAKKGSAEATQKLREIQTQCAGR